MKGCIILINIGIFHPVNKPPVHRQDVVMISQGSYSMSWAEMESERTTAFSSMLMSGELTLSSKHDVQEYSQQKSSQASIAIFSWNNEERNYLGHGLHLFWGGSGSHGGSGFFLKSFKRFES